MSKVINYRIIRRCDGKCISDNNIESKADNFTIPLETSGYTAKHLHISKVDLLWHYIADEGLKIIIELKKNEGD